MITWSKAGCAVLLTLFAFGRFVFGFRCCSRRFIGRLRGFGCAGIGIDRVLLRGWTEKFLFELVYVRFLLR